MSDEFDLDSIELDDFDMDDFDVDDAAAAVDDRTPIVAVTESFASSAMDSLRSPETLRTAALTALPEGYESAYDAVDDIKDEAEEIWDETTQSLKPTVRKFKKSLKKVLPEKGGWIPDSVIDKLESFSETEESSRGWDAGAKEDLEDSSATLGISDLIRAQEAYQEISAEQTTIGQATAAASGKGNTLATLERLDAIRSGIGRLVGFNDSIASLHKRKSLELQYRQLHVTKLQYALQQEHSSASKSLLDTIVHNTGLPDYKKERLGETTDSFLRDQLITKAHQTFNDYTAGFKDNLLKNIKGKIGGVVGGIKEKVGTMSELADTIAESGDEGGNAFDDVGSMAGGMGVGLGGDWLAGKLAPHLAKNSKIRQMGEKLQYYSENAPALMNEVAKGNIGGITNADGSDKVKTMFKGTRMEKSFNLNDAFREATSIIPAFRNNEGLDIGGTGDDAADAAAKFSNAAAKSIVEIIPGYLGKILKEVSSIRAGATVDEIVYDTDRAGFVSQSKYKEKLLNKFANESKQMTISNVTTDLLKEFGTGLSDEAVSEFERILIRNQIAGTLFTPELYSKMSTYNGVQEDIATELSEFFAKSSDFIKLDSDGKEIEGSDDYYARQNKATDLTTQLGRTLGDTRGDLEAAIRNGDGDLLRDLGLVASGSANIDHGSTVKYLSEREDVSDLKALGLLNDKGKPVADVNSRIAELHETGFSGELNKLGLSGGGESGLNINYETMISGMRGEVTARNEDVGVSNTGNRQLDTLTAPPSTGTVKLDSSALDAAIDLQTDNSIAVMDTISGLAESLAQTNETLRSLQLPGLDGVSENLDRLVEMAEQCSDWCDDLEAKTGVDKSNVMLAEILKILKNPPWLPGGGGPGGGKDNDDEDSNVVAFASRDTTEPQAEVGRQQLVSGSDITSTLQRFTDMASDPTGPVMSSGGSSTVRDSLSSVGESISNRGQSAYNGVSNSVSAFREDPATTLANTRRAATDRAAEAWGGAREASGKVGRSIRRAADGDITERYARAKRGEVDLSTKVATVATETLGKITPLVPDSITTRLTEARGTTETAADNAKTWFKEQDVPKLGESADRAKSWLKGQKDDVVADYRKATGQADAPIPGIVSQRMADVNGLVTEQAPNIEQRIEDAIVLKAPKVADIKDWTAKQGTALGKRFESVKAATAPSISDAKGWVADRAPALEQQFDSVKDSVHGMLPVTDITSRLADARKDVKLDRYAEAGVYTRPVSLKDQASEQLDSLQGVKDNVVTSLMDKLQPKPVTPAAPFGNFAEDAARSMPETYIAKPEELLTFDGNIGLQDLLGSSLSSLEATAEGIVRATEPEQSEEVGLTAQAWDRMSAEMTLMHDRISGVRDTISGIDTSVDDLTEQVDDDIADRYQAAKVAAAAGEATPGTILDWAKGQNPLKAIAAKNPLAAMVAKTVMSKVKEAGGEPPPEDVKDIDGNVVLSGVKMANGEYTSVTTGDTIDTLADIDGDVADSEGNVVVSADTIDELEPAKRGLISKAFGAYGRYVKGAFKLQYNVAKAIVKTAWGAAKFVGRGIKSLFVTGPSDVYVVGQRTPILRKRLMEEGQYSDQLTGNTIKTIKDITGPVLDMDGNVLIGEEEFELGLRDNTRKPILTRIKDGLLKTGKNILRGFTKPFRMVGAAAKGIYKFFKRTKDIYVTGESTPKLIGKQIDAWNYFNVDGSVIKEAKDIKGAVVDRAGQILLSDEDIEKGLVDNLGETVVIGRTMSERVARAAGAAGLAAAGGLGRLLFGTKGTAPEPEPEPEPEDSETTEAAEKPTVADRFRTATDSVSTVASNAWNSLPNFGGAGEVVAPPPIEVDDSGITDAMSAGTTATDTQTLATIESTTVMESLSARLMEAVEVLKPKEAPRAGSWQTNDIGVETEEEKEEGKMVNGKRVGAGGITGKLMAKLGGLGGLAGLMPGGGGGDGEEEEEGGGVEDAAAGGVGGWLAGKLKSAGNWAKGKATSALKAGKNAIVKHGGTALRAAGRFVTQGVGRTILVNGARMAATAVATAAGIITAPIAIAVTAVAAVGIGAYYGYKYYKSLQKSKNNFLGIRLKEYGADGNDFYDAALELEGLLEPFVKHGSDGAELKIKDEKLPIKEIKELFDLDELEDWGVWYNRRFKPVFLSYHTALKIHASGSNLADMDESLDVSQKLAILKAVSWDKDNDDSPYHEEMSPWEDEWIEVDPETIYEMRDAFKADLDEEAAEAASEKATDSTVAAPVVDKLAKGPKSTAAKGVTPKAPPATGTKPGTVAKPDSTHKAGAAYGPVGVKGITKGKTAGPATTADKLGAGGEPVTVTAEVVTIANQKVRNLVERAKMWTYGLSPDNPQHVSAIAELERYVGKNATTKSDGSVTYSLGSVGAYVNCDSYFGISQMYDLEPIWSTWFRSRFLPTYLTFASACKQIASKDVSVIDLAMLTKEHALAIGKQLIGAKYTTFTSSSSVWESVASPFYKWQVGVDKSLADSELLTLENEVAAASKVTTSGGNSDKLKALTASKSERVDYSKDGQYAGGSLNTPSKRKDLSKDGQYASGSLNTPSERVDHSRDGQYAGGSFTPSNTNVVQEHPGGGTGGDVNDLPMSNGDGSWAAHKDVILAASDMAGVDPSLMATMASIESAFKGSVKASTSSATGLYQFINSTWKTMLKKYGSKYGIAPDASRTDTRANTLMGAEFLKENQKYLVKKLGRGVSSTDLYLAHFLGAGGAGKLLQAGQNDIAADTNPAAARANPSIFNNRNGSRRTLGGVYKEIDRRVRNHSVRFEGLSNSAEAGEVPEVPSTSDQLANQKKNKPDVPVGSTPNPGMGASKSITPDSVSSKTVAKTTTAPATVAKPTAKPTAKPGGAASSGGPTASPVESAEVDADVTATAHKEVARRRADTIATQGKITANDSIGDRKAMGNTLAAQLEVQQGMAKTLSSIEAGVNRLNLNKPATETPTQEPAAPPVVVAGARPKPSKPVKPAPVRMARSKSFFG